MKKLTLTVLAAVLCLMLAVPAFAADVTYDTAVGRSIKIDDINGTITGEDATIATSADAFAATGSKWSIYFTAKKVADNVYVAISDGIGIGGNDIPAISLGNDEIVVVVHSSTSDPDQAALYPNWEAKVTASAVKTGDYLVLGGIDLTAGTSNNGTVTFATKEQYEGGEVSIPEPDTGDDSSAPAENTSSAPAEDDSSATEDSSVAPNGETPAEVSEDDEVKTSDINTENWFKDNIILVIVLITVAIVALIAIVVVIMKKK